MVGCWEINVSLGITLQNIKNCKKQIFKTNFEFIVCVSLLTPSSKTLSPHRLVGKRQNSNPERNFLDSSLCIHHTTTRAVPRYRQPRARRAVDITATRGRTPSIPDLFRLAVGTGGLDPAMFLLRFWEFPNSPRLRLRRRLLPPPVERCSFSAAC